MYESIPLAVLCSGSASSFRFLCEHDQNYEKLYRFVGVFSDCVECSGLSYAKDKGIQTAVLDFKAWCSENKVARNNLSARERYFAEVLQLIEPWGAQAILLSGFMLILTEPLLSVFRGRVLNVHPVLLSICDDAGKRKYTGLRVVARAMQAGDPTGSTVHVVTSEPDMGPIVAESAPLPYTSVADPKEHQVQMKERCDGPAYQRALEDLVTHGWPSIPWGT